MTETDRQTDRQTETDRQTDRQSIIKLLQYVFGYAPVKLEEIATITRGGNFQKKDFIEMEDHAFITVNTYTHFEYMHKH